MKANTLTRRIWKAKVVAQKKRGTPRETLIGKIKTWKEAKVLTQNRKKG